MNKINGVKNLVNGSGNIVTGSNNIVFTDLSDFDFD